MIKKAELLAPAGSKDAFYAAVNSGADAVYLGGKSFNARQYSDNFDNEELKEIIKYAHSKNVKVYITVNILIKDNEIVDVINYVKYLYEIDVDAVIVQDLGLIYLIRKYIPQLKINVSTQATIYDAYGIGFFDDIDINRFILARELSLKQVKQISQLTDKPIETFIHGALCMCYSGQCYFSSFLGGRSGNRGKCAQPCRLNYSFYNKNKNLKIEKYDEEPLLSLKDFKAGQSIKDLIDAGVSTLKIEGRMKTAEYTGIIVEYYRHLIDMYLKNDKYDISELEKNVESVFSRGFTNGYLSSTKEDMFAGVSTGSKGDDIHEIIDKIKERTVPFSQCRRIDVDLSLEMKLGERIKLVASDGKNEAVVYSDEIVEKSLKNPVNYEMLSEQLDKLGNSIFKLNKLNICFDEGVFARKSTINQLRRESLDNLYELRANVYNRNGLPYISRQNLFHDINHPTVTPKISFKINSLDDIKYINDKIGRIYVPYNLDTEKISTLNNVEKYLWIPNILDEEQYQTILANMDKYEKIFDGVCVNNIGSFYFFKKHSNFKIHCGYFFNIINTFNTHLLSEKGAEGFTFSVESNIKDIESISQYTPLKTELIAYAYVQLMSMKNCPFSVIKGCKSNGNCSQCEYRTNYQLKDRKNINFNIERENHISILYNSVPLTTLSKTDEFLKYKINYYFIDSKWAEDIETVIDILDKEINEKYVENVSYDILKGNSFTRGHYFKSVL